MFSVIFVPTKNFLIVLFVIALCFSHEILTLVDDFKENHLLGRDLSVVVIAKDFTQVLRHQRWWLDGGKDVISNQKKDNPKQTLDRITGRKEHGKQNLIGSLFGITLNKDELVMDDSKWKRYAPTPSGISFHGKRMIVSTGAGLEEFDLEKLTSKLHPNKWFKSLHSVEYNRDGTKVLVAATGFDSVYEYDLKEEKIVWEWNAWENGYEMSPWEFPVTRNPQLASQWENEKLFIFADPEHHHFQLEGIPKSGRPCHLNGAFYHDEDEQKIGICFLHKNMTLVISKNGDKESTARIVLDDGDIYGPHGFEILNNNNAIPSCGEKEKYLTSSTRDGRVLFLDDSYEPCLEISIKGLPFPPHYLYSEKEPEEREEEMEKIEKSLQEWLQYTSTPMNNNIFVSVDSKRGQLVLIDVSKLEYRVIPTPLDMSIQQVILEPEDLSSQLIDFFSEEMRKKQESALEKTKKREGKGGQSVRLFGTLAMKERKKIRMNWREYKFIPMNSEGEMNDFKKLCNGEYFPYLNGFMNEDEYHCVLQDGTLCDGTEFWSVNEDPEFLEFLKLWEDEDLLDDKKLPFYNRKGRRVVVKSVSMKQFTTIRIGDEIVLFKKQEKQQQQKRKRNILGLMKVESMFTHDMSYHSFHMYGKSINPFVDKDSNDGSRMNFHRGIGSIFRPGHRKFIGGRMISCFEEEDEIKNID